MRTGKHRRPLLSSAAALLTLVAAAGSGVLVGPAPARAADTVRGLEWYLDPLKIPQAHKLSRGKGVVVAVVDTGVYAAHPDLKGQVLPGKGLSRSVAADGRSDPDRENGHGTAVAGIIAGRGGGVMHLLGVAPEAKILPVGIGNDDEDRDVAGGIRWAADHGADVINLSLGDGTIATAETLEAVRYALGKDAVVVAAAGNIAKGMVGVQSPANIPGVIAAGGTDRSGGFWSGSVDGPEMVLAAPGEHIISSAPPAVSPNGYMVSNGTSLSAPIISGVAALVRARYPKLDAANVVNRLIRTARDAGPSGRDPEFGFGVVDPLAALTRSVPPVTANPLLEGAAPAPSGSARSTSAHDDEPMVTFGLAKGAGPVIQSVLCLLVVVALVVVLVLVARRGSRRRVAPAPPRPPFGPPPGHVPPGTPPPYGPSTGPGQPAGFPPPGYAPPPGHPQHPYQPRPLGQPAAPHPYAQPGGPGVAPGGSGGPVPPPGGTAPSGPEQG